MDRILIALILAVILSSNAYSQKNISKENKEMLHTDLCEESAKITEDFNEKIDKMHLMIKSLQDEFYKEMSDLEKSNIFMKKKKLSERREQYQNQKDSILDEINRLKLEFSEKVRKKCNLKHYLPY